jgi:hypothetical protein
MSVATNRVEVERLLEEHYSDVVYNLEDGVVWVSGMNAQCRHKAELMAAMLSRHDIPTSLLHDDDAKQNGGLQFRYGDNA